MTLTIITTTTTIIIIIIIIINTTTIIIIIIIIINTTTIIETDAIKVVSSGETCFLSEFLNKTWTFFSFHDNSSINNANDSDVSHCDTCNLQPRYINIMLNWLINTYWLVQVESVEELFMMKCFICWFKRFN